MFKLFDRRWKREQEIIAQSFVNGMASTAHVAQELAELEVAHQHQSVLLEQVVEALDATTDTMSAARNLMAVMAQRTVGDHPLFLINDAASPGEVDMLRHAIVTLQAHLAGSELPAFIAVDRVAH